jgi:hypothetical protein
VTGDPDDPVRDGHKRLGIAKIEKGPTNQGDASAASIAERVGRFSKSASPLGARGYLARADTRTRIETPSAQAKQRNSRDDGFG